MALRGSESQACASLSVKFRQAGTLVATHRAELPSRRQCANEGSRGFPEPRFVESMRLECTRPHHHTLISRCVLLGWTGVYQLIVDMRTSATGVQGP
jgi:hypothetical protein